MMRTYKELISINDFYDRFEYTKLFGQVGEETFGFNRYLNQRFYKSKEWEDVRSEVLARDEGFDLSHSEFPIGGQILVHHLNPIKEEDILDWNPIVWDPEYLVSVSKLTHNAIHFGDQDILPKLPINRSPNDTRLW